MVALQPGHVVNDLVIILDGELRSIRIRSDIRTELIDRYIRKVRTKACERERDVRHWNRSIRPAKRQAYFIGQTLGETMNVCVREKVLLRRQQDEELR